VAGWIAIEFAPAPGGGRYIMKNYPLNRKTRHVPKLDFISPNGRRNLQAGALRLARRQL
jgi:hypothetical protein